LQTLRFELEPCDETFFERAPVRHVGDLSSPLSAEQLWTELTRDGTLSWCRAISRVTWTSPRPLGLAATRTVRLALGAVTLGERYFRWEEGRRKSFYVERSSLPLFRRFAEDYLVQETVDGSRLTWTIAAEPFPATRPGAPVNALLARSLFADTRRHLASLATSARS
jgi:hypothetical protein